MDEILVPHPQEHEEGPGAGRGRRPGTPPSALTTLERRIAELEEGQRAVCFTTGMAAVSAAVLHCIERDAHIVAMQTVESGTRSLLDVYLRKFGVEVTALPTLSVEELEDVSGPDTRLIYLESPSGSVSAMVDLALVAEFARSRGIITVVDNTWATPLFQKPLRHGADIVVQTNLPSLDPRSDSGSGPGAGAVVGKAELMDRIAAYERTALGSTLDPQRAAQVLRGLRTLPARVRQYEESGLRIARFLEAHPRVGRVFHPGLPSHPQYDIGRKQMTGYAGPVCFVPTWSLAHAREFLGEMQTRAGADGLVDYTDTGLDEVSAQDTGFPRHVFRVSVGPERAQGVIDALDRALMRF